MDEKINLGCELMNEFFSYNLWNGWEFHYDYERRMFQELTSIKVPHLEKDSIGNLAHSLRTLGDPVDNLEELRKAIHGKKLK